MSLYGTARASAVGPVPGTHPPPLSTAPSRKRKERDYDDPNARLSFYTDSSSSYTSLLGPPRPLHVRLPLPAEHRLSKHVPSSRPAPATARTPPPAKPGGNRLLMAGYLAHEFLSRGTLFGRPYDTTTAQGARKEETDQQKRKQQYEEVARILWGGGAHVPGVINPSQLGGWLQKLHDK